MDLKFPIVECTSCSFVFAGLLPPADFLDQVYEAVIDPRLEFLASCSPNWVAHQLGLGKKLLAELADIFREEQSLRILDFGCGYGTLVRALSGPRVECLGFESSAGRLEYLAANNLSAVSSIDEVRARGPYHGIVLSDVLEHVPDPRNTLALCRELLAEGGLLLVNVPLFSLSRLKTISRAVERDELSEAELNPWEHLNYFSSESLQGMLRMGEFTPRVSTEPVDFGLRVGLQGFRKWGNGLKSLHRFVSYFFGWSRPSCSILAQKRSGIRPEPHC